MKILGAFVMITILIANGFAQDRRSGMPWTTHSEVIVQNGMVCSSHPLATQVGIDILKKGGTAVDAAIAVNACLGLMQHKVEYGFGGNFGGYQASCTMRKRKSIMVLRKAVKTVAQWDIKTLANEPVFFKQKKLSTCATFDMKIASM